MPVVVYISSCILVLACITYLYILINRHKRVFSPMQGMVLSMGAAMMGSTLIGTILGIIFKQMTWPTMVSVILGIGLGYLTGRPVHMVAALDGMLARIMGGLMGPMLGVMVANENPLVMVGFLDCVFIGMIFTLVFFIREHVKHRALQTQQN
ncbi:hypothetical protein [Marinithermofilum abyssi]|uniref:hypothetical protein n=1 Tax=Marinithermofilum abyssi TaxID=1571185 RepID=UPI0016669254|nr:hypothetical protein [Marinithermofilum abyssi]